VFEGISSPAGLDEWWTARSSGSPVMGTEYELWFGPEYDWRAVVRKSRPGEVFELELTRAMKDWHGTRVGFELAPNDSGTMVRFYHAGWNGESEHYRISCYCWAMYLRILRRNLEFGEQVPYEKRLDV
jgi:uncharacterized protein YndB with AHSA1/START domain